MLTLVLIVVFLIWTLSFTEPQAPPSKPPKSKADIAKGAIKDWLNDK